MNKLFKCYEKIKYLSGLPDGKIYIFGAGDAGKKLAVNLRRAGINIHAFFDNNAGMTNNMICGVSVCNPDILSQWEFDNSFICCAVAGDDAYYEIRHQLESYGLSETGDFGDFGLDSDRRFYGDGYDFMEIPVDSYDLRYKYLKTAISRFKQGVNTPTIYHDTVVLPVVDFKVCTTCTFSCEHCTVATPHIAKHKFFEPETICADFDKLLSVCYTPLVLIVGGESLLHPQITDIVIRLTKLRNLSHIGRCSLITNATILPERELMEYYRLLPASEIVINDYGRKNQRIKELSILCEEYGVECLHNFEHKKAWGNIGSLEKRNYTEGQLRHLFYVCLGSPVMYDGMFYSCCRAASLVENRLVVPDNSDSINIRDFQGTNGELKEILYDYVYKKPYIDVCNYCGGLNAASPQVPVGR
jgi:hypothetical protein